MLIREGREGRSLKLLKLQSELIIWEIRGRQVSLSIPLVSRRKFEFCGIREFSTLGVIGKLR